jgi:hypothetical protein
MLPWLAIFHRRIGLALLSLGAVLQGLVAAGGALITSLIGPSRRRSRRSADGP